MTIARTPLPESSAPVRMVKAAMVPDATRRSMRAATVARDAPVVAARAETGVRAL